METRLFSNRKLVTLIVPLVIEQGLTNFVGMCDGMMVSDEEYSQDRRAECL